MIDSSLRFVVYKISQAHTTYVCALELGANFYNARLAADFKVLHFVSLELKNKWIRSAVNCTLVSSLKHLYTSIHMYDRCGIESFFCIICVHTYIYMYMLFSLYFGKRNSFLHILDLRENTVQCFISFFGFPLIFVAIILYIHMYVYCQRQKKGYTFFSYISVFISV